MSAGGRIERIRFYDEETSKVMRELFDKIEQLEAEKAELEGAREADRRRITELADAARVPDEPPWEFTRALCVLLLRYDLATPEHPAGYNGRTRSEAVWDLIREHFALRSVLAAGHTTPDEGAWPEISRLVVAARAVLASLLEYNQYAPADDHEPTAMAYVTWGPLDALNAALSELELDESG